MTYVRVVFAFKFRKLAAMVLSVLQPNQIAAVCVMGMEVLVPVKERFIPPKIATAFRQINSSLG